MSQLGHIPSTLGAGELSAAVADHQWPLRAARRRPAAAIFAIFFFPYFFLPTAAATALGSRAPDLRAEAATALNRFPVPSLGFFFAAMPSMVRPRYGLR